MEQAAPGWPAARERRAQHVAVGRHYLDIDSFYGNRFAGLRKNVRAFVAIRRIHVEQNLRVPAGFDARAMIHEIANRQLLG